VAREERKEKNRRPPYAHVPASPLPGRKKKKKKKGGEGLEKKKELSGLGGERGGEKIGLFTLL